LFALNFYAVHLPPFTVLNKEVVSGPFYEIAKQACKISNLKCTFNTAPWKRIMFEVKRGNYDACFVVGKNKVRTSWMSFSSPVARTEYGFFYIKGYHNKPLASIDLKGRTIIVHAKSNTHKSLLKLHKKLQNFKINIQKDVPTALKMFANKRFGETSLLYGNKDIYKKMYQDMNIKQVEYAFSDKPIYYRYGFSKKSVTLQKVSEFEKGLQLLKNNGFLKNELEKYGIGVPD
jgi:polar amino acid transport system substrate-binding protein